MTTSSTVKGFTLLLAADSTGYRVSVREIGGRSRLCTNRNTRSKRNPKALPSSKDASPAADLPKSFIGFRIQKEGLGCTIFYFYLLSNPIVPVLVEYEPLENAFFLWMSATILRVHSKALHERIYKIVPFLNGPSFNQCHRLKYKKITLDFNGCEQWLGWIRGLPYSNHEEYLCVCVSSLGCTFKKCWSVFALTTNAAVASTGMNNLMTHESPYAL